MQTKNELCLQIPSMIYKISKEKNFRSRRCVDREIGGHKGQQIGYGIGRSKMVKVQAITFEPQRIKN